MFSYGWSTYWCEWGIWVTPCYFDVVSLCLDVQRCLLCVIERVCMYRMTVMYVLSIVIVPWWIVLLISMKWLALSLFDNFGLKSAFSDLGIAVSALLLTPFSWDNFFLSFYPKDMFILSWEVSHFAGDIQVDADLFLNPYYKSMSFC